MAFKVIFIVIRLVRPSGLQTKKYLFSLLQSLLLNNTDDYRKSREIFRDWFLCQWASLVAQLAKNPSARWKTRVRSLGWEDLLEKGKATHSSILAWRIPWTV